LRSKELLVEAARRGVAFVAGEAFHVDGGGQDALRLNFAHHGEEAIQEGVRRLGEALTALVDGRRERRAVRQESARPIV